MDSTRKVVFDTVRLTIRLAAVEDMDFFYQLWTDPQVMVHVGFPQGLLITRAEIQDRLAAPGTSPFNRLLVIDLQSTRQSIGECYMQLPNAEGIASTDVKLLPAFWGRRYGLEVKRGLLDYIFTHTDAIAVEATPNVDNVASIKMQEAVGGKRVGESVYQFPPAMQSYTAPLHSYTYRVTRKDWQSPTHE